MLSNVQKTQKYLYASMVGRLFPCRVITNRAHIFATCFLIALVCLFYVRRLPSNHYPRCIPGEGQHNTCNARFLWPFPGMFSLIRLDILFFEMA